MGTLRKVRFKLAWQNYRVGDVIEPNGTLRDWLISNGFAELVEQPQPDPPVKAIPARKRQRVSQ